MQHFNTDEIQGLSKLYRLNLINSITGYKSANMIGTKSNSGEENVAIFSSITHLGSSPALLHFTLRPNTVPRDTYKNIKENRLVQEQEFYGKKFLVKDQLQAIEWNMGTESKLIGQYMCFKATASVPTSELSWYNFSWQDLREEPEDDTVKITQVEAWYTLQIPLRHGPAEYWGLPGLILEVSAGNTTILCSQIVLNPKEKVDIKIPEKGKEITKNDYQTTIKGKMMEMRNNRGRRRS